MTPIDIRTLLRRRSPAYRSSSSSTMLIYERWGKNRYISSKNEHTVIISLSGSMKGEPAVAQANMRERNAGILTWDRSRRAQKEAFSLSNSRGQGMPEPSRNAIIFSFMEPPWARATAELTALVTGERINRRKGDSDEYPWTYEVQKRLKKASEPP